MVILKFNGGTDNISVDINDLVYYVANVQNQWNNYYMSSESELQTGVSTHIFIGHVSSITKGIEDDGTPNFTITTEEPSNTTIVPPNANDFIFFVKNNKSELASVKGYYSSITFQNNSTKKAELFAVSLETVESSK